MSCSSTESLKTYRVKTITSSAELLKTYRVKTIISSAELLKTYKVKPITQQIIIIITRNLYCASKCRSKLRVV